MVETNQNQTNDSNFLFVNTNTQINPLLENLEKNFSNIDLSGQKTDIGNNSQNRSGSTNFASEQNQNNFQKQINNLPITNGNKIVIPTVNEDKMEIEENENNFKKEETTKLKPSKKINENKIISSGIKGNSTTNSNCNSSEEIRPASKGNDEDRVGPGFKVPGSNHERKRKGK